MIRHTRSTIFLLALLGTLALMACGGGSDVVSRPAVQLKVGDATYTEDIYSYCWPEAENNLACDLNATAKVQPEKMARVTAGDEVRFTVDSEPGTPQRFKATLLDGDPDVQDLGMTTDALYTVDLEDGLYRVQVDVEYDDVEGQPAYVSYVFGLEVEGVIVVVEPTPTPTPSPTNTPTVTPVPTDTPIPTETPVPTATDTPTHTPTLEPTELPPEESTELPTEEPTEQPTEEVATATPEVALPAGGDTPTVTAAGDLGEKAISGTVLVNQNGTLVPLAGVPVSYTHNSMASPDQASTGSTTSDATGQFAFDPIFLHDTDTVTMSVQVPGFVPQTVQRGGYDTYTAPVFEFVLIPLQDSTTQPTPGIQPTPTDIIPENIPDMSLTFAGRSYGPVGYQYCERQAGGERVCVELPAAGTVRRIALLRGAAAQLSVEGNRPQEVRIEYLTDTGILTGQPEIRSGDNTLLVTITPEPGSYIMAIRVSWGLQDATYFFRVAVRN